jgi:hypothetical protein
VAGKQVGLAQSNVVVERGPCLGEHLVEHPAHGEYGRSGVDRRAPDRELPHLSARCPGALEDDDVEAAVRQQEGGRQSADARTDDSDLGGHSSLLPCQSVNITLQLTMTR